MYSTCMPVLHVHVYLSYMYMYIPITLFCPLINLCEMETIPVVSIVLWVMFVRPTVELFEGTV